jgi:hypothetical protein
VPELARPERRPRMDRLQRQLIRDHGLIRGTVIPIW